MAVTTTEETGEHAEQVAADQEAMEAARADAATEAESQPAPIVEEAHGQLAIDEPRFSTDAGGIPPHAGELQLKAFKIPWETDQERNDQLLFLVRAYVDDIVVGSTKRFPATVLNLIEFPTELKPREAIQATLDLRARTDLDRAVIDHAAQLAQDILDEDGAATGEELAEAIRTQLYERYKIDDDAHEVTHGTDEHEEAGEVEEPAGAAV